MIKVVNLVSLLAAPILVQFQGLHLAGWLVVGVLAAAVVWGVAQSKKTAPSLKKSPAPGD
jgi:K(+)-stimulated pyrophosphate-energized sodium pump